MREWTATTTIEARPEAMLDVLTDPEACARWAPIPFDVEDLDAAPAVRQPGPRQRQAGRQARGLRRGGPRGDRRPPAPERGRAGRLRRALRPRTRARTAARSGHPSASVLAADSTGRVLASATSALLWAGALQAAISRLAREATATC